MEKTLDEIINILYYEGIKANGKYLISIGDTYKISIFGSEIKNTLTTVFNDFVGEVKIISDKEDDVYWTFFKDERGYFVK